MTKKIVKIKYKDGAHKMEQTDNGNWIDCYTYCDYNFKAGDSGLIDLGFSCKMPDGYDGIIAPRSSTFLKYGLLQANSIGIIDSTYCGDDDIWKMSVYATNNVFIPRNTRLCQFRLLRKQPNFLFREVDTLDSDSRGGFGSSGD